MRNGTEVDISSEETALPAGDALVYIAASAAVPGTFVVSPPRVPCRTKKLWAVVHKDSPSGHNLAQNDLFRLGRVKFRVRQLVLEGPAQPSLCVDGTKRTTCGWQRGKDIESKCCRICLMEGPEDDDPLLAPCACKGSINYVHLKCLRHWASIKLNAPGHSDGTYFYRPLTCELCKTALPTHVSCNGVEQRLVELPRTEPPFVVLENVTDTSAQGKGLHVISLAQRPLTMGRGRECGVRIADVSISRCHATISCKGGRFVLQDSGSKFGTCVAMPWVQVDDSKPVSLQVGRTVLTLSLPSSPSSSDTMDVSSGPMEEDTESGASAASPAQAAAGSPGGNPSYDWRSIGWNFL